MLFIIVLGIGLAIDAFAVSISLNLSNTITHQKDKLKVALSFGLFQAVMPIIGYVVVLPLVKNYGIIINLAAFGLLLYLGIKMIIESFKAVETVCEHDQCLANGCNLKICNKTGKARRLSNKDLITYSLATSIDALMAGLIIQTQQASLFYSVLAILVITFSLSFIGTNLKNMGAKIEKRSELVGGIILVVLGLKIILGVIL